MSKAKQQSITRSIKRGNSNKMPNSTKLTESARSLTTTKRTNKYIVQLPKKELTRRENLRNRKEKQCNES